MADNHWRNDRARRDTWEYEEGQGAPYAGGSDQERSAQYGGGRTEYGPYRQAYGQSGYGRGGYGQGGGADYGYGTGGRQGESRGSYGQAQDRHSSYGPYGREDREVYPQDRDDRRRDYSSVDPGYGYGYGFNQYSGMGGGGRQSRGRDMSDMGRRQDWDGDRGMWQKTTDEVQSWFGDEGADRRRDQDQTRQHRGKGPKNYVRSDERIREDVNDRFMDDPFLDASEIEIKVQKGEVTLDGTVDRRRDKRRAEDIAEQVSGVTHVQNNLRIELQPGRSTGAATEDTSAVGARQGTTRTS